MTTIISKTIGNFIDQGSRDKEMHGLWSTANFAENGSIGREEGGGDSGTGVVSSGLRRFERSGNP